METETVSEYLSVNVSDLVVRNPMRSKLDKDRIATLAGDIKAHGLNEPIVVRPLPGDKWDVIAGHRRIEAVKSLGWKAIDAHVRRDLTDVEALAIRLGENIHREDLDPVDKARGIAQYVEARRKEDPKVTLDAIGAALGISQTEVSHAELLLRQPKAVQDYVRFGRMSPGHVEHVLNPLAKTLAKEGFTEKEVEAAVGQFAQDVARQQLDIRTATEETRDFLYRVVGERRREQEQADAAKAEAEVAKALKGAKFPRCPKHGSYDVQKVEERKEGVLAFALCGDKWWAETGELYHTPAELKQIEQDRKARAKRAKETRKKSGKAKPVEREYAVFYSRAPVEAWAEGLLALGRADGQIAELTVHPNEMTVLTKQHALPKVPDVRVDLPGGQHNVGRYPVYFSAVKLADGKGGEFLTRVQIGRFRSVGSVQDNVVERGLVKPVRDVRAELLAFQRKKLGVKQADEDLWPAAVGAFLLGEKVRIAETFATKSHRGKQGAILAFDVDSGSDVMDRHRYGTEPGAPRVPVNPKRIVAVLGAGVTQKLHDLGNLEKATKFTCAACDGKVRVVVVEGKPARICDPCGSAEGKCKCAKKEKGTPRKKAKAK